MLLRKAFLFITVITLLSCAKKHDYKCTCDVTGQWNGRYTSTIHNQSEGDADMSCKNYGKSIVDGYGDYKCFIEKQN